jgi:hypothetical protein
MIIGNPDGLKRVSKVKSAGIGNVTDFSQVFSASEHFTNNMVYRQINYVYLLNFVFWFCTTESEIRDSDCLCSGK